MRISLIQITILLSLLSSPCYALNRYRCDGWVQSRPCEEGTQRSLFRGNGSVPNRAKQTNSVARIVSQALEKLSHEEGMWRGRVYGEGTTRLFLEITNDGKVTERRFMGEVYLEREETWFAFKSVLPNGSNWSWQVVATG